MDTKLILISETDLKSWVLGEVEYLAKDMGQTLDNEDLLYISKRVYQELSRRKDWLLGEVKSAFDSGMRGLFKVGGSKITVSVLLKWIHEQEGIRSRKYIRAATEAQRQMDAPVKKQAAETDISRMFSMLRRLGEKYEVHTSSITLADWLKLLQSDGPDAVEAKVKSLMVDTKNRKLQHFKV